MTKASNIETKVTVSLIFLGRIFAWFLSQKIQKGKGKNPKIQENYKSYCLSKKVLSNLKWQTFKWLVHFFQKWNKRGKKNQHFKTQFQCGTWFFLMQLVWEYERFSSSFSTSYRKSKYILIFWKTIPCLWDDDKTFPLNHVV